MSLSPGKRLGSYEILAPLGAGGMGEVYRARDSKLGREAAIKVLPEALASDLDRRQRFEQEARSASALNHPNILTIYDIAESDGTVYMAMELVEGKTLRELVASGEPVPTRKLLDLAVQTADGLAKAHSAGIVHRDLKPENIMVSKDGFAKILDFGLAKLTETAKQDESVAPTAIAAPTQPGTVMGTAGYMSPEQASGQPVDFRSDQFTLGTILYEMATGQRAFQRKTGAETLVAIIREEPAPLAQVAPKTPGPLRWLVERCLAKDPEERYASTKDLARDLRSVRDHLSETSASGGLEKAEPVHLRRRGWVVPALLALLVGTGLGFLARHVLAGKPSAAIQFRRLTFQRGRIVTARFAPDGQTIVYSAAWGGRPMEVFSTRADMPESRPLGITGAAVLSVSSTGEIALSMRRRGVMGFETTGILARVPLAGGAPREILESVQDADWSPDGQTLAVCRVVGNRSRLEYPVGKVLFETPGWVNGVRVSPDGKLLAFAEHIQRGNNDGYLKIIDTTGKLVLAGPYMPGFAALAWSPKGDEVWWGATRATSIDGKTRSVWASPGAYLEDIARDGSVLVADGTSRREIVGYETLGGPPRNLTELNWSFPVDISHDGKLLFTEQQRPPPGAYVRGLDGSPAVRLADGEAYSLSPDGRWALTLKTPERRQIVLVPTGAGEPRILDVGNLTTGWGNWFPDGKTILLDASEPGRGARLYTVDIAGGPPRAISPEGVATAAQCVSPDGRSIVARGPDGRFAIYPASAGEPVPIPWFAPDEVPLRWTADGRSLYVTRFSEPPGIVDIVEIASGKRSRFTQFDPPDPTGIEIVGPAVIAPDGKSYVYSYRRTLNDLYLATGMR